MSADKSLKISVKSDLREGQSLMKFLNDLAGTGNKVAKSLQGINLGGAGTNAQQGGLSKALLQQKSLFADLGAAGTKLARVLKEDLGRSTETLDKQLTNVNTRLKKAIETYGQFQRELERMRKGGKGDAKFQEGLVDLARDDINSLLAEKSSVQEARRGLRGQVTDKGGGQSLAQSLGLSAIPGIGGLLGAGTAMGAIFAGVKAVQFGFNALAGFHGARASSAFNWYEQAAQGGQGMGQYAVGLHMGGLVNAVGEAQVFNNSEDSARRMEYAKRMGEAAGWQATKDRAWNRIKGLHNPFSAESEREIFEASEQARRVAEQNALANFVETNMQGQAGLSNAAKLLEGSADTAMTFGRRMGNRMAFNNVARSVAGGRLTLGERMSLMTGLVGAGGRGALRYGGSAAASVTNGMDVGAAANIAAGGAGVGADLLAYLRATGLDPTMVQESLGRGALQFLGPGNLVGSVGGLVSTLTGGISGGMNSAQQNRMLMQNLAGMGVGQNVFAGGDQWQRTVNLANAVDAMPGGSLYAQNKLASMDYATAISLMNGKGKLPGQWSGLGITRPDVRNMVGRNASSVMSRWIDQGGTDRASVLARQVQGQFGGDLSAWARANAGKRSFLADTDVLGGLVSGLGDEFGSETEATGFIRGMGGRAGAGGHRRRGAAGAQEDDIYTRDMQEKGRAFSKSLDEATTRLGRYSQELEQGVSALKTLNSVVETRPRLPTSPQGK